MYNTFDLLIRLFLSLQVIPSQAIPLGRGAPTMQKFFNHWLFMLGMVGLITMLTACGGGGTSTTPSSNGSANTPTSIGNTPTTSSNSSSTLSFTDSGGQNTSYTFSGFFGGYIGAASTGTGKILNIGGQNQSANFILQFPYTGPKSYILTKGTTLDTYDTEVLVQTQTGSWQLGPGSSCSVTVASDSPTTGVAVKQDRLKGTFSCAALVNFSGKPKLTITNGQFDAAIAIH
jgi:hypothetical protein